MSPLLLTIALLLSLSAHSNENVLIFTADEFEQMMEKGYEVVRADAEKGDADAQYNLALMYRFGKGVPENDTEAVKWYRKAAEQGHAKAQSNLGYMYDHGEGVPENKIKAYLWYSLAKAQGNEVAKTNLEITKNQITKEQIAKAQELASKCWESEFKDCD